MLIIKSILIIIHVIISALLVATILLQSPKGGGLSGSIFGGGGGMSSALFGPRSAASVLSKLTQYLAAGFLLLSLVISLLVGAGSTKMESDIQKVLGQNPAANLPQVETYDGGVTSGDQAAQTAPVAEAPAEETEP